MLKSFEFLRKLEVNLPPDEGAHHALCAVKYGSDETGWTDKCALVVRRNGKSTTLFLDDEELEMNTVDLVCRVVDYAKKQGI